MKTQIQITMTIIYDDIINERIISKKECYKIVINKMN